MINQREHEIIIKAKNYFDQKEYSKAQIILDGILETNDQVEEVYFYLGNIFHIKGEIGKAIKAFNRVLELNPGHTDASISLSILYNDIGRYEEAKNIFDKANGRLNIAKKSRVEDPHINKKFSAKHYELAELYLTYNRFDEALFEYNKSIGLDPENLDIRIKIAKVYAKKGFVSKAFDELRKLKNERPTYIPVRLALGVLYYGKGNILEAQKEWQNVLSKDPYNEEAGMYLNLSKTASETSLL